MLCPGSIPQLFARHSPRQGSPSGTAAGGLTAFNARGVAKAIAGQTGAGRVETLFELRAWAATVGGFVKPKVVDQPPTAPRTLFLYVPDRFVPGEV